MEGGGEADDSGGAANNAIKSTKSGGSDAVTINIRRSNATEFAVQASLESSVESFKSVIAKNCNVPGDQQFLVYKGWLLKNDRTLKTYGLEAEHTVHLVGGLLPAESNNTSNTIEERVPMTSNTIYHLINNSEAMRNLARNTSEYKRIQDNPRLSRVVNRDACLSRIVNSLIYNEFFCEIIRGIYVSRGGGDTLDVITLLLANPTTAHMLHSLLFYLQKTNWRLDPRLREKTQNPIVNRQLTSPQTMQQSLLSKRRREQSTRDDAGEMDSETEDIIIGVESEGSTSPTSIDSNVGPEEVYASQLAQLQQMGLSDRRKNLEALVATRGNVLKAVYRLLGLH